MSVLKALLFLNFRYIHSDCPFS